MAQMEPRAVKCHVRPTVGCAECLHAATSDLAAYKRLCADLEKRMADYPTLRAQITEKDGELAAMREQVADGLAECNERGALLHAAEAERDAARERVRAMEGAWRAFKSSLGCDPETGERYDSDGAFVAMDNLVETPPNGEASDQ